MSQISTNSVARTTITFCFLTAVCEGIDLQAAGVAASGIVAEFSPSPRALGTFFSASTMGLFVGALIGGRLADRIGRKTVLVTSIVLFGLFSLLTPLMPDVGWLVAARVLTGLGLGGALPNLIALVSESTPENQRKASVALAYCGAPIGGAVVSIVSLFSHPAEWRWLFVIGGVAPLLLAPIMGRVMQESALFMSERATAAAEANVSSQAYRPKRGSFMAIFAAGRTPRTLLLWIAFFLALLILYLLLNWLPTLLVSDGFTSAQAATVQIGFNLGGAMAGIFMGRILETRFRMTGVIVTFIALPALLLALARSEPHLAVILSIVFLLGCAVLSGQSFLYAIAPAGYPTAIRGVGVGAAVAAGRLGSIAGPLLGGVLKAAGHDTSRLLMDLLPIVLVGSVTALLLAVLSFRQEARATLVTPL